MEICDLEPEGSAPYHLVKKYGGKFGFFEKIKLGGVGSPKIKYLSGLEGVDEFIEETAGSDIPYVNFEFLKNGILARINKTQYLKGVMIAFDEITDISLTINRKMLNTGNFRNEIDKINLESSKLQITSLHGETLTCEVSLQAYPNMEKYFQKHHLLKEKFTSEITE